MSDLIGINAILIVTLITFFIANRWKTISNIIYTALIFRVLLILIGHYLLTLPDSTRDAVGFEWGAWERAKDGTINVFNNFPGFNFFFYQWIIAIPYSLFGRSVLMMQSFGLLVGVVNVLLGWMLAKKLWGDQIAIKVGWILALFPTMALYSILPLREVYATFFILVAMFGVVKWVKDDSLKSIFLAVFGFAAGTAFHGGVIVGGFIFSIFVFLRSLKKSLELFIVFRFNPKHLFILLLAIVFASLYLTNNIFVPKFGTFEDTLNLGRLQSEIKNRLVGEASYPEWTKIEKPIDFISKAPVRTLYFLFSPFIWDINKPAHFFGFLDGLMYMILIFLIFLNRKVIWKDPSLRLILIILVVYFVVFGFGVSNFGAGTRHRSKFVIEMIILAAPFINNLLSLRGKKN